MSFFRHLQYWALITLSFWQKNPLSFWPRAKNLSFFGLEFFAKCTKNKPALPASPFLANALSARADLDETGLGRLNWLLLKLLFTLAPPEGYCCCEDLSLFPFTSVFLPEALAESMAGLLPLPSLPFTTGSTWKRDYFIRKENLNRKERIFENQKQI